MRYDNLSYRAVAAAERARLSEFDDCDGAEDKYCPVCGTVNPEDFYKSIQSDECIGCSECVDAVGWSEF